jgi:hypothetical protein
MISGGSARFSACWSFLFLVFCRYGIKKASY